MTLYLFQYQYPPIRGIYARDKQHILDVAEMLLDPTLKIPKPLLKEDQRVPSLEEIASVVEGKIRFDFGGVCFQNSQDHPLQFYITPDFIVEVYPESIDRFQSYQKEVVPVKVGNLYLVHNYATMYHFIPEDILDALLKKDVSLAVKIGQHKKMELMKAVQHQPDNIIHFSDGSESGENGDVH